MATKATVWQQMRGLQANFWFANWLEANERLAYFGARAILPLYMIYSVAQGGLGLSYAEKGTIFSIWAVIQCLVPMLSGGFTDQYGYKKSLYVAYTINILGYLSYAAANGFWSALGSSCLIGLGTAIFKPPVQGTIAKASNEENSSIAWGIFYWMVNVGGFLAPVLAAVLRGETNFKLVFLCAAGVTAFNFLPTYFFYQEPPKAPDAKPKTVGETIALTLSTLKDRNFLVFLAIFSGFWLMFMQLWDLLPNFIDEWVTSRDIAPLFAWVSKDTVLASGNVKPEMLININSFGIIALMLPISWLTGKVRPMTALIGGMTVSVAAFIWAGATPAGLMVALAIGLFSIGEMMCSPKFSEYIGLTAPPDKKALYMGYSNIPFAVGWGVGNFLSGFLYESMGSKIAFARRWLIDAGAAAEQVKALPAEKVMETMTKMMNGGAGATIEEANKLLWDMHHPWKVWVIIGSIGVLSTVGMMGYYWKTRHTGISSRAAAPAAEAA